MATLKKIIAAVEDNNEINDSRWSDWDDALHILDTYAPEGIAEEDISEDEAKDVLDRAVESNGESLQEDLPKFEKKVWGQNFAGSF